MSESIVKITDTNFEEEVLKSDKPVLVDFGANWCGPCVAIAPIFEKVAKNYSDRVKFGKIDVDESQSTAQRYKVFSIPTLLLFQDGKVVGQSIGLIPEEKIEELLQKVL